LHAWIPTSRRARVRSSHPKSAALLAFAKAVVDGHGTVSAGDFEAARAAGLTDAELGDVVGHVAVNILQNYFNKAFEVDIDFPSASPIERAAA
jgi:alkylhydroperoxidase family enzyme